VIRAKDEVERLRKEFNGVAINYLERFNEKDHK
jgi:hypothetical protein